LGTGKFFSSKTFEKNFSRGYNYFLDIDPGKKYEEKKHTRLCVDLYCQGDTTQGKGVT